MLALLGGTPGASRGICTGRTQLETRAGREAAAADDAPQEHDPLDLLEAGRASARPAGKASGRSSARRDAVHSAAWHDMACSCTAMHHTACSYNDAMI